MANKKKPGSQSTKPGSSKTRAAKDTRKKKTATSARSKKAIALRPSSALSEKLASSGLTQADAKRCGFRHATEKEIQKAFQLTGFGKRALPPALLIPYNNLDGSTDSGMFRVRVLAHDFTPKGEDKPRRYGQPKAVPPKAYLSKLHGRRWDKIAQDVSCDLLVVEGELKAECAAKHGCFALGLGGVFNFQSGKTKKLLPILDEFQLNGRRVEIVFDAPDTTDNPQVIEARNRLSREFMERGAKVYWVDLPCEQGGAKVGLDDFIVSQGLKAFEKLPRNHVLRTDTFTGGKANLTDKGNADRLIAHIHGEAIYIHEFGKWAFFDDSAGRWLFDDDDSAGIIERAKQVPRLMLADASKEPSDEKRQKLIKHAMASESKQRLDAAVALARTSPTIRVYQCQLDANPFLLGVRNGVLDLRTGALRSAATEEYVTKQAHVAFDPSAKCPQFVRFLHEVMGGSKELVAYLRRAAGYSLTADVGEEVLFFLYGTGQNGKTTLVETMRAVLGDYAMTAPMDLFKVKQWSEIPNDIARLRGSRFVSATETEEGMRIAEAKLKLLTSRDRITARFMRQEFFEFDPTFKFWVSGNHKPIIRGTDHGVWRRIHLIPFTVQIPKGKRDKDLLQKLRHEAPGILNWMLEGCLDWQRNGGLRPPKAVLAATNEYRNEMDILNAWIEESCDTGRGLSSPASGLYDSFKFWAAQRNERELTSTMFSTKLRERGFDKKRVGKEKVVTYVGIQLKQPKYKRG